MSAALEGVPSWSRNRWATTITITVTLQFVFVLLLSSRTPFQPRTNTPPGVIVPERVPGELQALTDPTLLALGGSRSFSSLWLQIPPLPTVDADWKETAQWLGLDAATLGENFLAFARSNTASLHELSFKTTPEPLAVSPVAMPKPLRTVSTLEVKGALAQRSLLSEPDLPSWPATDLLLPSEVRVTVDTRGRVISAILQSSSGSNEADQFAVKQARKTRFTAAPPGTDPDSLTLGQLVFRWHATRMPEVEPGRESR